MVEDQNNLNIKYAQYLVIDKKKDISNQFIIRRNAISTQTIQGLS
jgi:hypothetical protein